VWLAKGTFVADLPGLNVRQARQQLMPAFGFEEHSNHITMRQAVRPRPEKYGSRDPAVYCLPGLRQENLYWEPKDLQLEVTLENGAEHLQNSHVDSELPLSGSLIGSTLTWTSTGGFKPFLMTTQWGEVERRSDDQFYAGLLLGVGAASLLAFFVELPDAIARVSWPWARTRRHPTRRKSTGTGWPA
jgi:hypothetical protein